MSKSMFATKGFCILNLGFLLCFGSLCCPSEFLVKEGIYVTRKPLRQQAKAKETQSRAAIAQEEREARSLILQKKQIDQFYGQEERVRNVLFASGNKELAGIIVAEKEGFKDLVEQEEAQKIAVLWETEPKDRLQVNEEVARKALLESLDKEFAGIGLMHQLVVSEKKHRKRIEQEEVQQFATVEDYPNTIERVQKKEKRDKDVLLKKFNEDELATRKAIVKDEREARLPLVKKQKLAFERLLKAEAAPKQSPVNNELELQKKQQERQQKNQQKKLISALTNTGIFKAKTINEGVILSPEAGFIHIDEESDTWSLDPKVVAAKNILILNEPILKSVKGAQESLALIEQCESILAFLNDHADFLWNFENEKHLVAGFVVFRSFFKNLSSLASVTAKSMPSISNSQKQFWRLGDLCFNYCLGLYAFYTGGNVYPRNIYCLTQLAEKFRSYTWITSDKTALNTMLHIGSVFKMLNKFGIYKAGQAFYQPDNQVCLRNNFLAIVYEINRFYNAGEIVTVEALDKLWKYLAIDLLQNFGLPKEDHFGLAVLFSYFLASGFVEQSLEKMSDGRLKYTTKFTQKFAEQLANPRWPWLQPFKTLQSTFYSIGNIQPPLEFSSNKLQLFFLFLSIGRQITVIQNPEEKPVRDTLLIDGTKGLTVGGQSQHERDVRSLIAQIDKAFLVATSEDGESQQLSDDLTSVDNNKPEAKDASTATEQNLEENFVDLQEEELLGELVKTGFFKAEGDGEGNVSLHLLSTPNFIQIASNGSYALHPAVIDAKEKINNELLPSIKNTDFCLDLINLCESLLTSLNSGDDFLWKLDEDDHFDAAVIICASFIKKVSAISSLKKESILTISNTNEKLWPLGSVCFSCCMTLHKFLVGKDINPFNKAVLDGLIEKDCSTSVMLDQETKDIFQTMVQVGASFNQLYQSGIYRPEQAFYQPLNQPRLKTNFLFIIFKIISYHNIYFRYDNNESARQSVLAVREATIGEYWNELTLELFQRFGFPQEDFLGIAILFSYFLANGFVERSKAKIEIRFVATFLKELNSAACSWKCPIKSLEDVFGVFISCSQTPLVFSSEWVKHFVFLFALRAKVVKKSNKT